MAWRLLRAIVLLPGTVLMVIPGVILWLTSKTEWAATPPSPAHTVVWFGLGVGILGLGFGVWTVSLFVIQGRGTPAPWDPPTQLVITGPYRHVRNPMITSVLLMLLAESLLFQSVGLFVWWGLFFLLNAVYLPLNEEKALEARFRVAYRLYKAHVPRWVPRLRPWRGAYSSDSVPTVERP